MIPYKNRFHGHKGPSYVYKNGQAVHSRLMVLRVVTNTHRKDSRATVVISKKTLKSAVGRNRIRRRVYEYIRTKIPEFNGVYDIALVISSSEMLNVPYGDMTKQIDQLFKQTNVLKQTKDVAQKKL